MKKTLIFITALALTALTLVTSCQKDSPEYRILTGEKVRFSIGSAGAGTKAVYSGEGNDDDPTKMTIERIDWEENDRIRIYCAAASEPVTKYADYAVTKAGTPNATNPEISETDIEAVGGAGLVWGEGEHIFYGVYPSPEEEGSITTDIKPYEPVELKSSVTKSISGATVTAKLPASQNVIDLQKSGVSYTATPDLNNMLMTAKSREYDPMEGIGDGEVFLAFTPLTTAVKFTITNQTKAELTLSSVSLISASNALNGKFTVNIDNSSKPASIDLDNDESTEGTYDIRYSREYPECTYTGGTVTDDTRKVTINFATPVTLTYDADPAKSGKLTFTFFLQPCQNFDDLTFKLVKSDNSWMSTRLGYTDGSGILFPRFKKTTVTGLFVPESAQWTVKYGPVVEKWNDDSETIYPAPELKPITVVTPWEEGVEDLPLFKYDYSFNATGTFHYDYSGGSSSLNITSKKTSKRFIGDESQTEVIAVPWHLEYWDEADEQWATPTAESRIAEFVTFDKVSGSGNISADESIDMTVDAAAEVKTTHNARLRATSLGSESKPYDLSMHDILGNERKAGPVTANCYVIRAKGWYCLPLVYGNAIDYEKAPVSGNYSPAYSLSYLVDDDQTHILHNFSNYTVDDYITTPFIEHDIKSASKTPSAALLWSYSYSGSSDAPISSNIITDVQIVKSGTPAAEGLPLGTSCSYIKFRVTDDITQSNSVIAVKDGDNKIMWSWHIWITDEDMSTQTAGSVQMLPVNLGWAAYDCTSDISTYPGKSLKIRIVQDDANNNAKEFTIERKEYIPGPTGSGVGTNTFYQWGRKDPFLAPGQGSSIEWPDKVSSDGYYGTIDYSRRYPAAFITGDGTDGDWLYQDGTSTPPVRWAKGKTIFDPCPPGWRLPEGGEQNNVWEKAGIGATSFDSANGGMNFLGTYWYPAAGTRAYDTGEPSGSGTKGYYWTLTTTGQDAYYYRFDENSAIDTKAHTGKGAAHSVRCCREDFVPAPEHTETAVDLSANGTANCYIVPSKGMYKFNASVKGNGTESVGTPVKAETLWETFSTLEVPGRGEVITSAVTLEDGYAVFSTGRNGNAVIAVKDASDNILWSWHIWVCEGYDPVATQQVYYNNAGTMMDRNLGALGARPEDLATEGLLYQWGRKDPFPNSCMIPNGNGYTQGEIKMTQKLTAPVISDSVTGTVEYAVSHPTSIISSGNSDHWLYSPDGNTPQDHLWDEAKTIYDPCPPGWKVPESGVDGVWNTAAGKPDSNNMDSRPYSTRYDENHLKGLNLSGLLGDAPMIWYPLAGYIELYSNVNEITIGHYNLNWSGYYWGWNINSSFSTYYEDYIYFRPWQSLRGAISVRCQKIE